MPKISEKASIKDIAQAAGVSISTVSRVINGKRNLQPGTVERVLEAVDKFNYKPNAIASNLARKHELKGVDASKFKTGIIGFLGRNDTDAYLQANVNGLMLNGAESVSQSHGLSIMFSTCNELMRDGELPAMVARGQVDGVVLDSWMLPSPKWVENIASLVPVVLLSCRHESVEHSVSSVMCDNYASMHIMIRHLIEKGHRRIGFLGIDDVNRPTDILKHEYHTDHDQRLSGYLEAMRLYKLPFDNQYLFQMTRDWQQQNLDQVVEQAVDQMLQMGDNRPTAICCAADIYAITMCNVLRKKGLSVPKDLALVGFDNSQVSLLNDPPLTTMAMPYLEMGKAAGRLLIEMIGDPTMVSRTINLDCQLIERKTCSLIM
ncbi:MAG TPA: hypothetical protein DCM28_12315 [Phycisphaerales bacterium]|nr:hypothetical protein [Phycisphaerales bacterium]|tara:strand:- start:683 stop:1807 length:1125 start_codon:yes stop_codon:yes gene_type:complete